MSMQMSTSPGATLGLGFLFFDTNNHIVAEWVTAPDTQYLLESVRPDFLLLRTLAKGLILWSSVSKTRDWVESHIPSIVARHAFQRHETYDPRIDYETMSQAYCNIVSEPVSFLVSGMLDLVIEMPSKLSWDMQHVPLLTQQTSTC